MISLVKIWWVYWRMSLVGVNMGGNSYILGLCVKLQKKIQFIKIYLSILSTCNTHPKNKTLPVFFLSFSFFFFFFFPFSRIASKIYLGKNSIRPLIKQALVLSLLFFLSSSPIWHKNKRREARWQTKSPTRIVSLSVCRLNPCLMN